MKNLIYKSKILNEIKRELSLRDFVKISAKNDPDFFRWLFDEDFENDFDASLTDEQKEEYNSFLNTL